MRCLFFGLLLGAVFPAFAQDDDAFFAGDNYARPRVIGEAIADSTVKDRDGNDVSLATTLKGKYSLVVFVHPSIVRSLAMRAYFRKLEPFLLRLGYEIVVIVPTSLADFRPVGESQPGLAGSTATRQLFDPKRSSFQNMGLIDDASSLQIIPTIYLVGPDGVIRYQHSMIDSSTPISGEILIVAAKITKDYYLQRSRALGEPASLVKGKDESTRDLLQPLPSPDATMLSLLVDDDLAHSDSYWMQAGLGGSLYNARDNKFDGRWSPGIQVGKRGDRFGYFGNLALDYVFDFTQEIKRLDMIQIGGGVEYLALWGHIRSSLSVGASILNSDTDIDKRGKVGVYFDFRPLAIRRKLGRTMTLEFSPLAVDFAMPVVTGIPLMVFHYFTVLSVEWNTL